MTSLGNTLRTLTAGARTANLQYIKTLIQNQTPQLVAAAERGESEYYIYDSRTIPQVSEKIDLRVDDIDVQLKKGDFKLLLSWK